MHALSDHHRLRDLRGLLACQRRAWSLRPEGFSDKSAVVALSEAGVSVSLSVEASRWIRSTRKINGRTVLDGSTGHNGTVLRHSKSMPHGASENREDGGGERVDDGPERFKALEKANDAKDSHEP
eukprot:92794-Rhodomonas_salina.2